MNDFESDWISLNQSFVQNGWIQDGRIQDGWYHQVNQIELVWVRVGVEWECIWVNLREDNKVSASKMAVSESNMAEFKMATIIKLCQNEWVKFFCAKWLNPRWQNSSWLPSSSWMKMNEWSFFLCKMVESKMAKFKMAAIMKLSENEWVSVRDLCKMAESKIEEFKMAAFTKLSNNEWLWVRLN